MIYRTVDGDVLDDIVWNYYHRTDVLNVVMNANPGLCEQPVKLPAGFFIYLPYISPHDTGTITVMD